MYEVSVKQALIIFVKNSIPGKVKTRLAASIGDSAAMEVYQKLLDRTRIVTQDISADLFIYYSDYIPSHDIWPEARYGRRVQQHGDLGERMSGAISEMLESYEQVLLIGSDIADLDTGILHTAFHALTFVDVVIGPSRDGGYYLIGMKQPLPVLFEEMQWSHDAVSAQTRQRLIGQSVDFKVLPVCRDIDTVEDLNELDWHIPE